MLAMKSITIWPVILIAATFLSIDGLAQVPGQNLWKESEGVWKLRDNCRRDAFKQFPDYTVEANAKRESAERQCLEANNLPYTAPQTHNNNKGAPQL
jgi:hypothetical protein